MEGRQVQGKREAGSAFKEFRSVLLADSCISATAESASGVTILHLLYIHSDSKDARLSYHKQSSSWYRSWL